MKPKHPETIDQRLVRALAHPLRVQILEILSERVANPTGYPKNSTPAWAGCLCASTSAP
ncbi:MAG TPA: hypothetical protein VHM66_06130 [Solirubrobacterales bacterium]|nr:hypothetical protein [Solirubrobacterales bacterium]